MGLRAGLGGRLPLIAVLLIAVLHHHGGRLRSGDDLADMQRFAGNSTGRAPTGGPRLLCRSRPAPRSGGSQPL
jgi:hypothetical protein